MASWDVDELESQLLFREEDKDGIETEIRRITGNRNIELLENERKDGLVAGRLEADGERWPCGDVGPMDMRGMVRIASLFEERSVLGFCDSYSDFYRLETRADGKVLAKRLSAGDAYETLRWDSAPFTKQYLYDGALEETGEKRCWKLHVTVTTVTDGDVYVAAESLADALAAVRENDALADALSVADFDPWREIYPEGHAEPCRLDPVTLGDDGWALESWLEDVGTTTEAGTAGVSVSLALADED
mgnify:FL=1